MKVIVEFECETAAFYEAPSAELQRVFDQAADIAANGSCGPNGLLAKLRDSNGNTVGHIRVIL